MKAWTRKILAGVFALVMALTLVMFRVEKRGVKY